MTIDVRSPSENTAARGALVSLVYSSVATAPFSEVDLALLLAISRTNNQPRGVTGLLLYRDGRFIQALEGPEHAVRQTLVTIAADPRHRAVRMLDEAWVAERRFGSWAMGYRATGANGTPAWFGSPEAVTPHDGSQAAELLSWFRDH